MNYKKYLSVLMVYVSLAGLAAANYTGNYTLSDMDDIMIDNVGTAMVAVKGEIPNLIGLGILWNEKVVHEARFYPGSTSR